MSDSEDDIDEGAAERDDMDFFVKSYLKRALRGTPCGHDPEKIHKKTEQMLGNSFFKEALKPDVNIPASLAARFQLLQILHTTCKVLGETITGDVIPDDPATGRRNSGRALAASVTGLVATSVTAWDRAAALNDSIMESVLCYAVWEPAVRLAWIHDARVDDSNAMDDETEPSPDDGISVDYVNMWIEIMTQREIAALEDGGNNFKFEKLSKIERRCNGLKFPSWAGKMLNSRSKQIKSCNGNVDRLKEEFPLDVFRDRVVDLIRNAFNAASKIVDDDAYVYIRSEAVAELEHRSKRVDSLPNDFNDQGVQSSGSVYNDAREEPHFFFDSPRNQIAISSKESPEPESQSASGFRPEGRVNAAPDLCDSLSEAEENIDYDDPPSKSFFAEIDLDIRDARKDYDAITMEQYQSLRREMESRIGCYLEQSTKGPRDISLKRNNDDGLKISGNVDDNEDNVHNKAKRRLVGEVQMGGLVGSAVNPMEANDTTHVHDSAENFEDKVVPESPDLGDVRTYLNAKDDVLLSTDGSDEQIVSDGDNSKTPARTTRMLPSIFSDSKRMSSQKVVDPEIKRKARELVGALKRIGSNAQVASDQQDEKLSNEIGEEAETKGRIKWTEDELLALEDGMIQYGRKWRLILDEHGVNGTGRLKNREPVHLKDKARNEKRRRKARGLNLGIFEIVTE